jgi:hypothetical protein
MEWRTRRAFIRHAVFNALRARVPGMRQVTVRPLALCWAWAQVLVTGWQRAAAPALRQVRGRLLASR